MQTPQAWFNCSEANRQKLNDFYEQAYWYTKVTQRFLSELVKLPVDQRIALWNGQGHDCISGNWCQYSPVPAYWFGSYSKKRIRLVLRTFTHVLQRFERGYQFEEEYRPVRFRCLTNKVGRCRTGVIANASEYGTVRVCPRLLKKTICVGGMVVLHEMLHQDLGVDDQRDVICKRGDEKRCYRRAARHLVTHQKLDKALRNNDNYAFFARAIYRHIVLIQANGQQGGKPR
ncbi:MAG: hypothetical protein IGS38_13940 [Synechococcales cyanobacterium M58_A2018_015]|nr:hypothetical protein [Synechococcales cyanobacterium M58_A2018_015]